MAIPRRERAFPVPQVSGSGWRGVKRGGGWWTTRHRTSGAYVIGRQHRSPGVWWLSLRPDSDRYDRAGDRRGATGWS